MTRALSRSYMRGVNHVFRPVVLLILAPGLLLALWAQWRTHSAFSRGKKVLAARRITGAEAAAQDMEAGGVTGVAIGPVEGVLTDHYFLLRSGVLGRR